MSRPQDRRFAVEAALAAATGAAVFLALLGPGVLDPANIAWLQVKDPATYYLSWAFFRAAPWGWPPASRAGCGRRASRRCRAAGSPNRASGCTARTCWR